MKVSKLETQLFPRYIMLVYDQKCILVAIINFIEKSSLSLVSLWLWDVEPFIECCLQIYLHNIADMHQTGSIFSISVICDVTQYIPQLQCILGNPGISIITIHSATWHQTDIYVDTTCCNACVQYLLWHRTKLVTLTV